MMKPWIIDWKYSGYCKVRWNHEKCIARSLPKLAKLFNSWFLMICIAMLFASMYVR